MPEQQQLTLNKPSLQGSSRSNKKKVKELPQIPEKLYFTIGEASSLCLVEPHVLRYWEKEFSVLKPSKRRGQRRYYQRDDILLVRRIKTLLYEKGFTIEGARSHLKGGSDKPSIENKDTTKIIQNTINSLNQILEDL